jgi:hypothetical protein
MESFRYGLSIPYIQERASEMSRKLLNITVNKRKEGPVLCYPRAKRYRVLPRTVIAVRYPVLKTSSQ